VKNTAAERQIDTQSESTSLSEPATVLQLVYIVHDQVSTAMLRLWPNVNKLLVGWHGKQRIVASTDNKPHRPRRA